MQDAASGGVHDASGDGEDPQAEPFGLVAGRFRGQGEAGAPGQQVLGQCADRQPDPVLGQVVERQVAQPGVFAARIRSSTRAWRRWSSSSMSAGRSGRLVRMAVYRIPSTSQMDICRYFARCLAAREGCSRRTISRLPGGQPATQPASVASATRATPAGSASAGVHTVVGSAVASSTMSGPARVNRTENCMPWAWIQSSSVWVAPAPSQRMRMLRRRCSSRRVHSSGSWARACSSTLM